MKTSKSLFSYTFYLAGMDYARLLQKKASQFGKFKTISEIYGAGPATAFHVEGTKDDIKKFHDQYDLESDGVWYDETLYDDPEE